ncbi:hypothetical protein [Cytobacillus oceanisediminis]|uniref:Uncharacterized protein n=1 Tax=Cytobacillus oceanisediminis TaxID=665099 RepID=A0A562K6G4_9BACI|nr:hypothetical protein [Cytobacillus oceanisediminis]TWH91010.1 hypothetical protein IQ19_00460 [Cytobacillus oceanisediminis]
MNKDNEDKHNSKINTDDAWNRTFYGSPTIGGFVVIGIIIAFIIYNVFFK